MIGKHLKNPWHRCFCLCLALAMPVQAKAGEAVHLPDDWASGPVDLERHIIPLLSRLGCNAGSCHGASEGKGGFRLSLFGHDAAMDYEAITTGRIDVVEPLNSLILQKPSLTVDHEGGLRLPSESWEYQLIARWIADGADHLPGSGQLLQLQIEPQESVLTEETGAVDLRVMARFANGDQLDVTRLSGLRVQDESVAAVSEEGQLCRIAPGDTAVIATYSGQPASAYVLVPRRDRVPSLVTSHDHDSLIDRHVNAKLRRLHVEPAPPCSDETFLRRITLATTGQLPTPAAIREFAADVSPDKRDRRIDFLLSDPLHAAMWATRMCEITGSGDFGEAAVEPGPDHEKKWHAWFRVRFERDVSYDQIACGVLSGTTRGQQDAMEFVQANVRAAKSADALDIDSYANRPHLDLFWQRPTVNEEIDVEALAERVAAAFLGIRIECARCHKHPFDGWSQNDHRSFANVFTQVRFGMSPALRAGIVDALEEQRTRARQGKTAERIPSMREIYISPTFHDLRDAATQEPLPAKPLGGAVLETGGDRREAFVDWLTNEDNPYFARNFVNRVWAYYFGIGLVDPVDNFSAANPASHPKLLDALAQDFIDHGFNIRRLERQILQSAAWQRATDVNDTNRHDRRNYARAYVRVLPADVMVDAISCAIGDRQRRAVEVTSRLSGDEAVDTYFQIFNRPERKLTCDCERHDEPTLRQTMLLLADPSLIDRITEGHAGRLASSQASDQEIVDQLFLLTLSRWPDGQERATAMQHIDSATDRRAALADIMWSLINTREFATYH